MKFSGWQRLWMVCSIAWVIAVGTFYFSSHRSEEKLYHDWANALIGYLIEQSSDLRGHTLASVRSAYSDLSDKQLVDALHEKYLPKHPAYSYGFAEIDSRYRLDEAADIGALKFQPKLGWLVAALSVPALMYLTGLAIAWVRAGFRHA